ncbi:MAG: gliding motility-associated ABC transporter substrate-binding protein GldG, partial [Sphingobacteriia bacterium]
IRKTILLATDSTSRRLASPATVALNSVQGEEDMSSFQTPHLPVAVLLEGPFRSLFANRLMGAALDSLRAQSGKDFIPNGKAVSKQIVVSDADLFTNAISQTTGPLPMGMMPLENVRFGNREFFLNSVDYLSNDLPLYESRNKQVILRLLDPLKKQSQKSLWQVVNTTLPAAFFLALGLGLMAWRKKKYASA